MADLRHILLAEDEPDLRELVRISLAVVGGLEVTVCEDGAQALAAFDAVRHDLVVLDVTMPGIDGPETLARLRRLPGGERVPVVFLTARQQPEDNLAFLAMGALHVIGKPFDPMTLANHLRVLWEQASVAGEDA
ncbi:response regulator [Tistrella bauzanensis]|uniref:Response regulator n=1 Tax=Tistrella bauzanensis TaxID=657419 RepID=A0ABQ1I9Q3_9PROT|nr:response regulator [Tistrella bauzanensis]GGB30704.1 response regulator [Tistrella bauzanensis]